MSQPLLRFFCFLSLMCMGLFAQSVPRNKAAVPLIADLVTTHTTFLGDGNRLDKQVMARYYRDGQGRSRLDQGNTTTISDGVNNIVVILDVVQHTARRIRLPKDGLRTQQPNSAGPSTHERAHLGWETIDGIPTVGKEFVSVIPAGSSLGNAKPIEKVTQVWQSEELSLPVLVKIIDPVAGNLTTQYKNIQHDTSINPKLFEIPPDFQVREETAVRPPSAGKLSIP